MSDVFTKTKRSQVMSRIRGRGNKDTELALMKLFRQHRITGWRRSHVLIGKPDFAFSKLKLAVFVDGCFWHSCPKHAVRPKGNAAFWKKKLAGNRARDRLVAQTLRKQGWRVLRIWEHELTRKNSGRLAVRLRELIDALSAGETIVINSSMPRKPPNAGQARPDPV